MKLHNINKARISKINNRKYKLKRGGAINNSFTMGAEEVSLSAPRQAQILQDDIDLKIAKVNELKQDNKKTRVEKNKEITEIRQDIAQLKSEKKMLEFNNKTEENKISTANENIDKLILDCTKLKKNYNTKHEEVILLSKMIKYITKNITGNMTALTSGISKMKNIYQGVHDIDIDSNVKDKITEQENIIIGAKDNIKKVLDKNGSIMTTIDAANHETLIDQFNNKIKPSTVAGVGKGKRQNNTKRKKRKSQRNRTKIQMIQRKR